jgi:hypothetical protein
MRKAALMTQLRGQGTDKQLLYPMDQHETRNKDM